MMEIKLILCPIDFSEFSVRAYRYALSVAEHYRAKLVAQHIVELWRHPSAGFAASAQLYDEFCSALRENGWEELQKFVKNHTDGEIRPELIVQMGSAPDFILSFAQAQKADVIVMGTHGGRGYDRLTLGSVTNRVMRTAPCPVLAVCNAPRDSMPSQAAEGMVPVSAATSQGGCIHAPGFPAPKRMRRKMGSGTTPLFSDWAERSIRQHLPGYREPGTVRPLPRCWAWASEGVAWRPHPTGLQSREKIRSPPRQSQQRGLPCRRGCRAATSIRL